jgi:uncharacterized Zn-binding protein involved in type VI secretion
MVSAAPFRYLSNSGAHMPKAARQGDLHICKHLLPIPHLGGPVIKPCSPDVETNALPQARASDKLLCILAGAPNFIVTGSGTVQINGLLAARKTDKTLHPPPGEIVIGSPDVEIGGPTIGATLGGADATSECLGMAAGRTSGRVQQSYNNCAIESSRMLINKANGSAITEDSLLDEAMAGGLANEAHDAAGNQDRWASGGSWHAIDILNNHGVPATAQSVNMDNIAQAVAEKRGVITVHDAGKLWGTTDAGLHAINVTGIQYDADGKPAQVIMNDTGLGSCGRSMPAADFESSLYTPSPSTVVVTDNPVWK